MSKKIYPSELREHLVALATEGRSITSLAREFEPSAATIHKWLATYREQVDIDDPSLSDDDRMQRLERENRRLKEDNAILKKAAAWFARESLPGAND